MSPVTRTTFTPPLPMRDDPFPSVPTVTVGVHAAAMLAAAMASPSAWAVFVGCSPPSTWLPPVIVMVSFGS